MKKTILSLVLPAVIFVLTGFSNQAQAQNLFLAGTDKTIYEIAAGQTNMTPFSHSGNYYAYGVAFSASGNLFIADYAYGVINEIAAGQTNMTLFSSGGALSGPTAMAFSASGDLFIADYGTGVIDKIAAGQTNATIFSPHVSQAPYFNSMAFAPVAVPEPSTYALFGLGTMALLIAVRRRAS